MNVTQMDGPMIFPYVKVDVKLIYKYTKAYYLKYDFGGGGLSYIKYS